MYRDVTLDPNYESLCRRRKRPRRDSRIPLPYRLYGLPFFLAYLIPGLGIWRYGVASREGGRYIIVGTFAVIAICHVALLLACKWSTSVLCTLDYRREETLCKATFVRVVPVPGHGEDDVITPLIKRAIPGTQIAGRKFPPAVAYFVIHGVTYLFEESEQSSTKSSFCRIEFPTDSPIFRYSEAPAFGGKHGLQHMEIVRRRYGKNEIVINVPSYRDLFVEQATMPFFVFQVVCVGLWSLDEYWYYSLFSLLMLVIFEAGTAFQRHSNVLMLNDVMKQPHPVMVYRTGQWISVPSERLLPGDVMSVASIPGVEVSFPCDTLLLSGSCVVNEAALTGESLPQMKIAVDDSVNEETLDIVSEVHQKHRYHIVFSGVQVVQHDGSSERDGGVLKRMNNMTPPPDGGCVGVVLRTGSETVQGQLVGTIVHSEKQLTVNNSNEEIGIFITALVLVAIATSAFVLWNGLADPRRSRYKLFLHCIMIVTSVVPPELPMELSLAVTNSLVALQRKYIYCTKPFRIPLAGRVDTCCFDKTGTLTTDNLVLEGVASIPLNLLKTSKKQERPQDNNNATCDSTIPLRSVLTKPNELPVEVIRILAGCQSLMNINGDIFGDPIEKATLHGINWKILHHGFVVTEPNDDGTAAAGGALSMSIKILHSFPFNPDLRCMSNIVLLDPLQQNRQKEGNNNGTRKRVEAWLVSKGAPEAIRDLLCDAPSDYESSYRKHMMCGGRVLAIAYRKFSGLPAAEKASHEPRVQIERDLTFAGFLVLVNPLKPDASRVIRSLHNSSHRVVVVTGDNVITAADVAKQVGIVSCPLDRVHVLENNNSQILEDGDSLTLSWRSLLSEDASNVTTPTQATSVSTALPVPSTNSSMPETTSLHSLVVKNVECRQLAEFSKTHALCMTGDVMASIGYGNILKQLVPHITIFARISPEQKEMIISCLNKIGKTTLMVGDGTNDVGALKRAHVGISVVSSITPAKQKSSNRATRHISHSPTDGTYETASYSNDLAIAGLGDASIASPFTARTAKLSCVLAVIRQGRCTLITTLQVYKILALNCLTSVYALSTLYLWGVRQGDRQMTIQGIFVALLFFLFIRTKPLKQLSQERPYSKLFCRPILSSIISQCIVHTSSLIYVSSICSQHVSMDDPSMAPDADFTPNPFNSAIFLLTCITQINSFMWNYPGKPFMHPLKAALEVFPPLNDALELASHMDNVLKYKLIGIMMANTAFSWGAVKLTTR